MFPWSRWKQVVQWRRISQSFIYLMSWLFFATTHFFEMSSLQNSDNLETLFCFELLVEYIRLESENKVSDELALGVRLLDFPTLLVYQPRQRNGDIIQQDQHENERWQEYAFNRGKSCFFKMNPNSLHRHLSHTPLYAMVLDVKEDIPKLVGSSVISLAKVVDRINQDVAEYGFSTPSKHGERVLVYICNLIGEKIGSISLSYKLLSLGASLLPHIRDRVDLKSTRLHGAQRVQNCTTEKNISTATLPDCGVRLLTPEGSDGSSITQTKKLENVCVDTEHRTISQTLQDTENNGEEDFTMFCPPHLYYTNSAEEKGKTEGGDFTLLNADPVAFTIEDSEDEAAESETEGPSSEAMHQKTRQNAQMSSNQESSGLSQSAFGEALRQLPLLNALLVELSQLSGQNPHQPLSIHPNLAWIYRPSSTELSAEHGNTPQTAQPKSLQETSQNSPHLKHLHAPRNCSTLVFKPASVKKQNKKEQALIESKSSHKSPRKKLVFGTTKTFNLRLKNISPFKAKRHECMEFLQNDKKSNMDKEKRKICNKMVKSSKRKSEINQRSGVNENIETMMQSITLDSALHKTIMLKQINMSGKGDDKQHRDCLRISEQCSLSKGALKCVHIPTVDSDSVANKEKNEHHSESNQSQSEYDRQEKNEFLGSGSSSESSFADSIREGDEEADYADDFNSLEPSDSYSPDPMSSPEPFRAKTPLSPVHPSFSYSDSGSESVQRRPVLPVPIKAPSSPQRALRGTHIIRPRTHISALSFSSNDEKDASSTLQSTCSRRRTTRSSRVERTFGAESFASSRSERSESTKTSGPVQGFSAESQSSYEPQEREELEDELGSLDFRKEYQHISKLVVSKLPGYTM